jgi:SAM-dependent methyltransferase
MSFLGLHLASNGHRVNDGNEWLEFPTENEMDIRRPLPFPDDHFDAVFMSHCLEHVASPDQMRFLLEAHRVLKRRGWLRLIVPGIRKELGRPAIRDLFINHGHLATHNYGLLECALWAAGFDRIEKVEKDTRYDHHHLERAVGEAGDAKESLRVVAWK